MTFVAVFVLLYLAILGVFDMIAEPDESGTFVAKVALVWTIIVSSALAALSILFVWLWWYVQC